MVGLPDNLGVVDVPLIFFEICDFKLNGGEDEHGGAVFFVRRMGKVSVCGPFHGRSLPQKKTPTKAKVPVKMHSTTREIWNTYTSPYKASFHGTEP